MKMPRISVCSLNGDTLEEYAYGQIEALDAAQQIIDGANDVLSEYQ